MLPACVAQLTVLRRTNQRLEEELRSREQEIAALKALGSTAEGQGADGGGKGKGEEGSAEKGVADGKPQEGEGPEDGGKGKGQGAKGATPRALQASGSSSQLAVSTLSADDLDELQRSYDKQLQSTEKELVRAGEGPTPPLLKFCQNSEKASGRILSAVSLC